jgi:hypothetical protein
MKKLTMIYIGRRLSDDIVLQAFLHNRKEYYWTRIKFAVIGGKFEAKKAADGSMTMNKSQFSSGHIDESEIKQEWLDADSAAEEFLKKRREKNRAKNLITKKDWEVLKPRHYRCRKLSFWEQGAFADHIARLVLRGDKK